VAQAIDVADLGLAAHLCVYVRGQVDAGLADADRNIRPHDLAVGKLQPAEVQLAIAESH
jgi:hypothetical protein